VYSLLRCLGASAAAAMLLPALLIQACCACRKLYLK
jgi:hypothetical protein